VYIFLNCLSVFLLATVSACSHTSPPPAVADAPAPVIAQEQPRVPDEYIVTLAPDVDKDIIFKYYGSFGIKDIYALGDEMFLLVLVNDPGPQKMESLINAEERIVVVQPNLIYWDNRSGGIAK
jgi:hypothetical protein